MRDHVHECEVIQSAGISSSSRACSWCTFLSFDVIATDLFFLCPVVVIHTVEYQCTSRARSVVHVADVTGSWLVIAGSRRECFSRDSTRYSCGIYTASRCSPWIPSAITRWTASAVVEKAQGEKNEHDSYNS